MTDEQKTRLDEIRNVVDARINLNAPEGNFLLSLIDDQAKEIERLKMTIAVSESATGVMNQAATVKRLRAALEKIADEDYWERTNEGKSAHEIAREALK
jgi:hypothetical protein